MNASFFQYVAKFPHPSLRGIVTHYRIKSVKLSTPLIFPNHSPVFQGLIFNVDEMEDIVFKKKEDNHLKYKVYYVGQAVSPSYLYSSSMHMNLIAVNFTPTGLYQLTGMDLHHLTDQIVDAQVIFGNEINVLHEKIMLSKTPGKVIEIIEQFLIRKVRSVKRQNKYCISASLNILNNGAGETTVKKLQQLTNTSPKTLERAFKSEIGMTPKMFQRLLRYNQARHYIQEKTDVDWWEIVIRFGFYDHSHFISEFRTFAGLTPMEYMDTLGSVDLKAISDTSDTF